MMKKTSRHEDEQNLRKLQTPKLNNANNSTFFKNKTLDIMVLTRAP